MKEFHKDTLENGLRIVTVEMPHLHSAEMVCYVGVGSRHEEKQVSGISHFLEHMLFRGTADYPTSLALEHAFENIGGAVNASTDAETTCYHTRLHPSEIREGASLFASMLRRPLFSAVETERRIILEEAMEDLNEDGIVVNTDTLAAQLLWPGHPLSQPTIGTRETIESITLDDLRRHHATHYAPANTVFAVAGSVKHDDVLEAASLAFADWVGPLPLCPLPFTEYGEGSSPPSTWVRDSDSQITFQLAFRVPGRNDRKNLDLRMMRRVLSWGGASRLSYRLREELGLVYSVEAGLTLLDETGAFTVDLATSPENLVQATQEVLKIFDDLRREPVTPEEMERAVRNGHFALEFSRDQTDEMLTRFGWGETVGYLRTIEDDRRDMEGIDRDSLRRTAVESFTPENLRIVVVGPYREKDRKAVEELLSRFSLPATP